MSKILIGNNKLTKNYSINDSVRCCLCHKYYDFNINIFSNNGEIILICPYCGSKHKVDFKLFKDKTENLISINELNLSPIVIGASAIDRSSGFDPNTIINKANPANGDGIITSIEIWAESNLSNCEVATFINVGGSYFSTRDIHFIGSVTSGSKQTFPGLSIDVLTGDYLGIYYTSGKVEADFTVGDGIWYAGVDYIPCTNVALQWKGARAVSVYGTGEELIRTKDSSRTGIYSFKTLK